ncbi:v-type c subunit family [Pyrenophora seminiperda CCB06]|uniref:V-type c subunit family n=1 Tax=Pyrenophora seminiperda CCB06 TaxID=1302712 RepID=A0A3M7M8H0_9PLEO|nr:v-type c subunit family [Pyrenophora seminiperda CCB06]
MTSVNSRAASLNTFCVFFVTPAYASQLLNGNDFLNVAIRAAYRALLTKPDVVIDVLCAVVHKLPVTRAVRNENGVLSRHELERLGLEPPVAGTGFEGMAYALLDPNASVSSKHLPPSDNGAIDFITAQHVSKGSLHLDTLRLPLANTVFQTGTTTTMFLSQWKTTGRMDGIDLISRTNVSHHGIRITPPPKSYSKLVTALSIPLIPLTVPRIVQGCMGNIIRQIVDSKGQSVQASSELESVVPRFFRSRGQPAQATVAWALVIPGHLKDTMTSRTEHLLANLPTEDVAASVKQKDIWELLWRSKPPMWNNLVSEALAEGARLHRVLSGGGGWGKKAGLLSLDPVPTNQATESSDDALLETDNDPEDFESTLTPVVQAGDSIQFFISPKSDLSQEASRSDNLKALESFPTDQACGPWGWEIGTIPSTVDSIPGESWQHRPLQGDDEITDFRGATVFRGGFGALTEGALTLTQHSMVWDEVTPRPVNTTMIDVPFSRLWAVNWREGKIPVRERPSESTRKFKQIKFLDAPPVLISTEDTSVISRDQRFL